MEQLRDFASQIGREVTTEELEDYFATVYPGKKDPEHIQELKGMCREWEAECLWGYYGWQCQNISHLRLGFYTGDIFTGEPSMDEDVLPIAKELGLTVFDPNQTDIEETGRFMRANGYDAFTTTLTVSPSKPAELINRLGRDIGEERFLERNFKKRDGFQRSSLLAREMAIYRQHYCGCVYSQ